MNNSQDNTTTTSQGGWILIIGCMAIGLAPFSPEPHLFGKVKWIMGGANGMQMMDWWDTIMHGVPMIAFVVLLIRKLINK